MSANEDEGQQYLASEAFAENSSGLSKVLSSYSPYSWRGRIGVIVPSTNTTLEPEFSRMAPAGVTVHVARIIQSGAQEVSSYRRTVEEVAVAAEMLATAELDTIALGCTSCTYFVPPQTVGEAIKEASGFEPILAATAVVEALKAVGAKRVVVVGPRTEFVTRREIEFLEHAGLEVIGWQCLGLGVSEEERRFIGRVPVEVVHRLVLTADRDDADAIFIGSTQLPTIPLINELEQVLGKPVVTSNQATFWQCLQAIGIATPIPGFGTLLSEKKNFKHEGKSRL